MPASGALCLMRVPVEAHANGGKAERPWVAEITGPCPKYGLGRRFVDPHTDWRAAHVAWSGNVYGRTAQFALRDGGLYEVGRYRGRGSRLHWVREFVRVIDGERVEVEGDDVLALVDGIDRAAAVPLCIADAPASAVARVEAVGTPRPCAFRVVDGERRWLLAPGWLYEVTTASGRDLVEVVDGRRVARTQREAIEWLAARAA